MVGSICPVLVLRGRTNRHASLRRRLLARNTAIAYRALLLRHFAAVDLDEVYGRHVLRALLAGGALLDEGDVAVDALHLDAPERLGDGLGIGLAGGLDALDDDVDAVPAAEAFREPADRVFLLVPCSHEFVGDVRVLHGVREPRREEDQMQRAVRRLARLLDQLFGRVRAASGDDARAELLVLGLLEDERDLL